MARKTILTAEMTFGELLRHLRRRAGMTQGQLALLVGFSIAQVSRLEQGERLPDLAILMEKFLPVLALEEEPLLAQELLTLAAAARGERAPILTITQQRISATVEEISLVDDPSLPAPPTPLIGRAEDVTTIVDRLWEAPGRLLTLLGPPGVGKTQLALAVGTKMRHFFTDGVIFVPLVTVVDPTQVPSALVSALGLTPIAKRTPQSQLIEYLRRKTALLILDNFEQIVEAAPLIATLLSECPAVRILVTSQAPLRLRAEQRFKVAPLVPAAAVELFFQRVQAINPDFVTGSAQAAIVAAICLRLDCLPLAIELIAPQLEIFSLSQLLVQLQNSSLDLLADGPRDLSAHHQTVRNAIHRSYALLSAAEQRLLRAMGIFVGGCSQEALLQLVDGGARPEPEGAQQWVTILHALLRKSLIQCQTTTQGERFSLFSTLRDYAIEQLTAIAELAGLQAEHARYFLAVAQQNASRLRSNQRQKCLEELDEEHHNLRAALQWSLTTQSPMAPALVIALGEFWMTRGHDYEARRWIDQLLANYPAPTVERAAVLTLAATFARRQADYTLARHYLDEGIAIYRSTDDQHGLANALRQDGWLHYDLHNRTTTVERFQESLALHRAGDNPAGIAESLLGLVHVWKRQPEQQATVQRYLDEGLALYRAVDEPNGIAHALQQLGEIELSVGDYAVAATRFRELLTIWRAQGAKLNIAWSLALIGEAAWLQQDLETAAASYHDAYRLFNELGNKDGSAILLHHLAQVARCKGDLQTATIDYSDSMAQSYALQNRHMMARCAAGLAAVALAQANHEHAICLLSAAQRIFDQLSPFLAPADEAAYQRLRMETLALRAADVESFDLAWQEGLHLSLAELVAYTQLTGSTDYLSQ